LTDFCENARDIIVICLFSRMRYRFRCPPRGALEQASSFPTGQLMHPSSPPPRGALSLLYGLRAMNGLCTLVAVGEGEREANPSLGTALQSHEHGGI